MCEEETKAVNQTQFIYLSTVDSKMSDDVDGNFIIISTTFRVPLYEANPSCCHPSLVFRRHSRPDKAEIGIGSCGASGTQMPWRGKPITRLGTDCP